MEPTQKKKEEKIVLKKHAYLWLGSYNDGHSVTAGFCSFPWKRSFDFTQVRVIIFMIPVNRMPRRGW